MFELPTGVGLLAIGASLFFLFVFVFAALARLPAWARFPLQFLAAAVLLIAPLAYVAYTHIEQKQSAEAPTGGAAAPSDDTAGSEPKPRKYSRRDELPRRGLTESEPEPEFGTGGQAPAEPPFQPAPPPDIAYDVPDGPAPGGGYSAPPEAPASSPPPEVSVSRDSAAPEPEVLERTPMPRAEAPREPASPDAAPPPASAPPPPPIAAPAPPEPEADFAVMPVYFGTDRLIEANAKRLKYGSERARQLQIGRVLVTVPKSHQVPQVERPWAIKIPYWDVTIYEEAEDPKKHFTIKEIAALSKAEFLSIVKERLAASARFKDQAVVFVHGYNTSFDNAVYRTAQIAYDLKFDGAPFLYSWPSGGKVASYTYDRESAEQSQRYMREFLQLVTKESGAKSVSIIAHSMGNQPLLGVLRDLKNTAPEGIVISQVILAAPDVDRNSFEDLVAAFSGYARGVTLYAASNDRALQVSRRIWGVARAGDVPADGPLVLPGVDTIDVTAVSTDTLSLNHSGYATNNALLTDIGLILQTGTRPPNIRFPKLEEKTVAAGGHYWLYPAGP